MAAVKILRVDEVLFTNREAVSVSSIHPDGTSGETYVAYEVQLAAVPELAIEEDPSTLAEVAAQFNVDAVDLVLADAVARAQLLVSLEAQLAINSTYHNTPQSVAITAGGQTVEVPVIAHQLAAGCAPGRLGRYCHMVCAGGWQKYNVLRQPDFYVSGLDANNVSIRHYIAPVFEDTTMPKPLPSCLPMSTASLGSGCATKDGFDQSACSSLMHQAQRVCEHDAVQLGGGKASPACVDAVAQLESQTGVCSHHTTHAICPAAHLTAQALGLASSSQAKVAAFQAAVDPHSNKDGAARRKDGLASLSVLATMAVMSLLVAGVLLLRRRGRQQEEMQGDRDWLLFEETAVDEAVDA
jgi:hypothetical protein